MALTLVVPVQAQVTFLDQPAQQSRSVQNVTVQALKMIKRGQWDEARAHITRTKDPLAAKLYYWLAFTKRKNEYSYNVLTKFVHKNPTWPSTKSLRIAAEKQISNDVTYARAMAWFDEYPPLSARGMSAYVKSLVVLKQSDKAKRVLEEWWAVASLSPSEQKDMFGRYRKLLTARAHKRRLDMLLFKKHYTNARALAHVLGNGYPQLAAARIALATQKKSVNSIIDGVPAHLRTDSGLMYERVKWRRKKGLNDSAIEILNNPPSYEEIGNPKDWWKERHILARRLMEDKQFVKAYILVSRNVQKEGFSFAQSEWLSGWLALRFLNKPSNALIHFEKLYSNVETAVSLARAAYWAGRSAQALKKDELSRMWYERAAQYQTVYYGQLAAARLGIAEGLPNAVPPVLTAQDLKIFSNNELIQSARLLQRAGMQKEAGKFIHAFVDENKTAKAYRYAAELSIELERYYDAVRIAKQATKNGLFMTAQSYPTIMEKMRYVSVERPLAHAIIRQESMFDVDARSHAGALGLMQLMPPTAREVSGKMGVRYRKDWLTTRPDYNIQLGTHYLRMMLDRFDNSYPLAIAAYNAGPGRVDKWIKEFGDPRTPQVDLVDWIELIPIYETRNYVQRVIEGIYVYRLRLKGKSIPR